MDIGLRLPAHWLTLSSAKGKGPRTVRNFANSLMSYTKMDVPTVELYETAVTFGPSHADPLGAHRAYHGAGTVLRCPACEDVAVRIGVRENELVLEWRGTFSVPRTG